MSRRYAKSVGEGGLGDLVEGLALALACGRVGVSLDGPLIERAWISMGMIGEGSIGSGMEVY